MLALQVVVEVFHVSGDGVHAFVDFVHPDFEAGNSLTEVGSFRLGLGFPGQTIFTSTDSVDTVFMFIQRF